MRAKAWPILGRRAKSFYVLAFANLSTVSTLASETVRTTKMLKKHEVMTFQHAKSAPSEPVFEVFGVPETASGVLRYSVRY
jgi:hypothetical protein